MQVQEPQLSHLSEHLRPWQTPYLIAREVDLLQRLQSLHVHHILQVYPIPLQIGYRQIDTHREHLKAAGELLVAETDHTYLIKCVTVSQPEEQRLGYEAVTEGPRVQRQGWLVVDIAVAAVLGY